MATAVSDHPARSTRVRVLDAARRPKVLIGLAYAALSVWLMTYAVPIESFIFLLDELIYQRQALGYLEGAVLAPEIHGERFGPPNGLYPLLLAPLHLVLSVPSAFVAAHALNCLLFASVLFPVYLLARRLGASWGWALAGGVLSVVVPYAAATQVMMTEVVAYPLAAWAALAITAAIDRPTPRHDLIALGVLGLAAYGRVQLALFGAVLVGGAVLRDLTVRDLTGVAGVRDWLRSRALLFGLVAGAALLYVVVREVVPGLLAGYEGATGKPAFPGGVWGSMAQHLGNIVSGVMIVPAVLWVAFLGRTAVEGDRGPRLAFAVVSLLAVAIFTWQTGYFAQNIAGGQVQERYLIYIVPLFAVGAVVVLSDLPERVPRLTLVLGGVLAAWLLSMLPFNPGDAPNAFARVSNPGAGFNEIRVERFEAVRDALGINQGRTLGDALRVLVPLGALALAFAFAAAGRAGRWLAIALGVVMLVLPLTETRWVLTQQRFGINAQFPNTLPGVNDVPKDWIDQAVDEDVALVPGVFGVPDEQHQWRWTEFWNKRVTTAYDYADHPNHNGFPAGELKLDPRTGALRPEPSGPKLLLVSANDPTLKVRGETVASAPWGAAVIRPQAPWRADWAVLGGAPNGAQIDARPQELSVYGAARAVELELAAGADAGGPVRFTLEGEGRPVRGSIAPGQSTTVRVTARPVAGEQRAVVRIRGTAPPPDEAGNRPLGLRIARVVVR